MRTSLRVVCCCFVFVLGMSLGTFSYSQEAKPEKPAEQTPQVPPGWKAIPEDLTANLNTSFYSKYVWRGLESSKDSLVIFPSFTIGYKGFAFNVWADLDTRFANPPQGEDKEFKLQETDITLSYTNRIKPLKLDYTLGWIYYDTDGFDGNTPTKNQELFTTLALDVPLKPTLSVYQEIETGRAWYATLGLSHGFKIYNDWSLDLGGWVSYLYNKSSDDYNSLHDGNLWAGLTIPLNRYFSVTPKIQYSFPLGSNAADRIEANSYNGKDSNFVYGGIIFDVKF